MLLKQSVTKTKRNALLFGEERGKTEKHRQKILRLNLETNSQPTAQLEKPEWSPGSWENHLYLLTAPAPPALGDCWTPFSISSPNPGQLHLWWFPIPAPPCSLPADRNFQGPHQDGHDSVKPHYFLISAESKGTLKRWIKGKVFHGENADIFALPRRILKACTSSSVFKELK